MADPVAFSLGFVIATGSLHIAGIALGLLAKGSHGVTIVRGFGVAILAAGCYYLAKAFGYLG